MLKGITERKALNLLKKIMDKNKDARYLIGKGFYNNNLPSPSSSKIFAPPAPVS